MGTPNLTPEARRAGTAASALARRQRADARTALNRGWIGFDTLLTDPAASGLLVVDALTAIPGVGRTTAVRLMVEAGVSPRRRIRGLGRVQQARLRKLLKLGD